MAEDFDPKKATEDQLKAKAEEIGITFATKKLSKKALELLREKVELAQTLLDSDTSLGIMNGTQDAYSDADQSNYVGKIMVGTIVVCLGQETEKFCRLITVDDRKKNGLFEALTPFRNGKNPFAQKNALFIEKSGYIGAYVKHDLSEEEKKTAWRVLFRGNVGVNKWLAATQSEVYPAAASGSAPAPLAAAPAAAKTKKTVRYATPVEQEAKAPATAKKTTAETDDSLVPDKSLKNGNILSVSAITKLKKGSTRDELEEEIEKYGGKVPVKGEGTGAGGNVIKKDLVKALHNALVATSAAAAPSPKAAKKKKKPPKASVPEGAAPAPKAARKKKKPPPKASVPKGDLVVLVTKKNDDLYTPAEKKVIDEIWGAQAKGMPAQYYFKWQEQKIENPDLTAEDFAQQFKKDVMNAGTLYYLQGANGKISASANVDESGDDDGNLEIYNLTRHKDGGVGAGKRLTKLILKNLFTTHKGKTVLLGPASGKLKSLYDEWKVEWQKEDWGGILRVGDNEQPEMRADYRYENARDQNNPFLLPLPKTTKSNAMKKKLTWFVTKKGKYWTKEGGEYVEKNKGEAEAAGWTTGTATEFQEGVEFQAGGDLLHYEDEDEWEMEGMHEGMIDE